MKFARRLFLIAGVYGVLALLPQYFKAPPATHREFYYGFIGVALAWQFAFFIIARDPVRYRAIIWPSVFEKWSFAIAAFILYGQGRLDPLMLAAAAIDLLLGILFLVALRTIPDDSRK